MSNLFSSDHFGSNHFASNPLAGSGVPDDPGAMYATLSGSSALSASIAATGAAASTISGAGDATGTLTEAQTSNDLAAAISGSGTITGTLTGVIGAPMPGDVVQVVGGGASLFTVGARKQIKKEAPRRQPHPQLVSIATVLSMLDDEYDL